MLNKTEIVLLLSTAFFFVACDRKPKETVIEANAKPNIENIADEIIIGSETDSKGNVLEYAFNNTKCTANFKLYGETIEMTCDTMASGSHYKNEHYNYSQWHGKTTITKDSKVIFEAGEEIMPK